MVKTQRRASTVIKVGNTGPILKSLSNVDLADHLSEARQIVEAAKVQAAQTVTEQEKQSRRKAAQVKEAANAEGYKAGFARGEAEGHAKAFEESVKTFERQHAGVVAQMLGAIREIEEIKDGLRIAAERDVLEFAVKLACALTYRIGQHTSNAAVENAKRAIRLVGRRTDLTIHVNPRDLQTMKTYASTVVKSIEASPSVAAIADESVAPGGCIVETDRTRVDATLETQIAELSSLLLGDQPDDLQAGGSDTEFDASGNSDTHSD